MNVGDSTEWGVTLAPAMLATASDVACAPIARGATSVLFAIATGAIRRAWPNASVASLSVESMSTLASEETAWVRATVAAIDAERGRATMHLAWTNQRGEGIARGSAVVRAPATDLSGVR